MIYIKLDLNQCLYICYLLSNNIHAGFQCEEHDNPADFFLDVVTTCEKSGNNDNDGFQGDFFKVYILTYHLG